MKRLVAALLLVCATAVADPKTATQLYADGQAAYQAQNYGVAAAKFVAAYEADPDPVYLFNAAQAFRFGNECQSSADYYHRFLAKVPNPPNADKIKVWLGDMETCAKAREPQKIEAPPPPPPHQDPPPPTPHVDEGTPTNGKRIAAYATGGIGAIALGATVYFLLQGRAAHDDEVDACSTGCIWSSDVEAAIQRAHDKGEKANTRATIAGVVGGVAVAAAVGLFVWSSGTESPHPVSIVPTSDGAMIVHASSW